MDPIVNIDVVVKKDETGKLKIKDRKFTHRIYCKYQLYYVTW